MAKKAMKFEEATERLEEIIRALESGEESLDDSLKLYEEGVALVRACTKLLNDAEQSVKMLQLHPDGTAREIPFDTED